MQTETATAPAPAEVKVPVASESPVTLPTPDQAATPPVESAEAPPAPESKPDEQATDKPKKPISERISQVVAQKKQAEAERTIALREVERLRRELEQAQSRRVDDLPYEQQTAAQIQQAVKAERYQEAISAAEARAQAVEQALAMEYQSKLESVRERIPDFDQALTNIRNVNIHDAAARVVVESDKAAEITYWLGKNVNEAQRIASLDPVRQVAEIARLEARLEAAPQVRKHSTAPPPPTTIAGASAPVAKDPANMTMAEYAAWRVKG